MLDTPGARWLAMTLVAIAAALLGSMASGRYQGVECGPGCLWRLNATTGEVCRISFSGSQIDLATCRGQDWVKQFQHPQDEAE